MEKFTRRIFGHLEIINPHPPSGDRQGLVVFSLKTRTYHWMSRDKAKEFLEAFAFGLSLDGLQTLEIRNNGHGRS